MFTPRRPRRASDDDALAFELAALARPHLSRCEVDHIYVAIGVGDTFEVLDALLTVISRQRIPPGPVLVATVSTWLDCYLGQASEPRLRQLLAEVKSQPAQQLSPFEYLFGSGRVLARDPRSN